MRKHVLMRKHIHYEDVVGKMFLQQFIYNVFSALLLSACSKAGDYKADQMVRPSLPCLFRETPDENAWRYGDFQAKPDAVSSMDSGCDPFAMMELRTLYTRRNATIVDEEKCTAMLLSTLIALERQGTNTSNLYFPFIIGKGHTATLHAAHFRQQDRKEVGKTSRENVEKIPTVSSVGGFDLNSNEERTNLFVALCVMLHNIKKAFSAEENKAGMEKHKKTLARSRQTFPSVFVSTRTGFSTSTSSSTSREMETPNISQRRKRTNSGDEDKDKDDLARQAARCGGLFCAIEHPWPRPIFIGEDFNVAYQGTSPYYFHATHASTGVECFLKLWRQDEGGFDDVRNEMRFLKEAQNHDIAVAKMITDDVVPFSLHDINFEVLATEYIESSPVSSVDELLEFSLALMRVVSKLHENARILHCDIKPNNLRWHSSRRQVYLIDFGHAQLVEGAKYCKATRDFEAPELREKMLPHSRETDSYSVGATILCAWNDCSRHVSLGEDTLDSRKTTKLRVVGESLMAPVHERVSLNHAICSLLQTLEE
ncbi:unnamed protein product [Cylindrotheca closterium]|uniref:non-specific serine/threonine protein kinase n=1 Tax=Cylindrotheca closterium TaxID=2856 RepID=A0AAD2FMZ2_9STRA|nr:unnamed protein product [Cylindrotheca closterium]